MEADLAGFTPIHAVLGIEPEPFPVTPLAWHPPSRTKPQP
jgi:hypothetical protein